MMKPSRSGMLALPGAALYAALFLLPMVALGIESLRLFTPGRVGAAPDAPFTLLNYAELLEPGFRRFFFTTLRVSFVTTVVGLAIAFPLAYRIVRSFSSRWRAIAIGGLVTFIFLSAVVKTYAVELSLGSVGPVAPLLRAVGLSANNSTYIEFVVGAGLLQFIIPIAALTLIGSIQNLDPRLVEAAQSLGAPTWKSHLSTTLPLSVQGLLAAFLLSFTFAISAFVVPMILGKGRVQFLSNMIYNRFSEVANYPSGAAISLVTLVVCFATIYLVTRLVTARAQARGEG
ncbi:MAG: ABC transporter permease [Dongiaceae bacterium]